MARGAVQGQPVVEAARCSVRRHVTSIKISAAERFLDAAARAIWWLSNPETAQIRAHQFVAFTLPLLSRLYRSDVVHGPGVKAAMLNRLLSAMTRSGRSFHLHTVLKNREVLIDAHSDGRGVLIATAHLRLGFAAHQALKAIGQVPVFVGNGDQDTSGSHWGDGEPLRTIDARHADVLIQCSRHVRRGNSLVAFVDYRTAAGSDPDAPVAISPNAFAWALKNNVPIVFMLSSLSPSGEIILEFSRANIPDDQTASGAAIAGSFAISLEDRYAWPCTVMRPREARTILS
jgi:hypothetical protein